MFQGSIILAGRFGHIFLCDIEAIVVRGVGVGPGGKSKINNRQKFIFSLLKISLRLYFSFGMDGLGGKLIIGYSCMVH